MGGTTGVPELWIVEQFDYVGDTVPFKFWTASHVERCNSGKICWTDNCSYSNVYTYINACDYEDFEINVAKKEVKIYLNPAPDDDDEKDVKDDGSISW